MSEQERDVIARQRDYMENGPGKVEAILNSEMSKLYGRMDETIKVQDEEFMTKVGPGKRWPFYHYAVLVQRGWLEPRI